MQLYHPIILGLLTASNLSNMLCPVNSNPFKKTEHYRIIATSILVFFLPLVGKAYGPITKYLNNTLTATDIISVKTS